VTSPCAIYVHIQMLTRHSQPTRYRYFRHFPNGTDVVETLNADHPEFGSVYPNPTAL